MILSFLIFRFSSKHNVTAYPNKWSSLYVYVVLRIQSLNSHKPNEGKWRDESIYLYLKPIYSLPKFYSYRYSSTFLLKLIFLLFSSKFKYIFLFYIHNLYKKIIWIYVFCRTQTFPIYNIKNQIYFSIYPNPNPTLYPIPKKKIRK